MRSCPKDQGSFLIEGILAVFLLVTVVGYTQLEIVGHWRERLDLLDEKRLGYDGVKEKID